MITTEEAEDLQKSLEGRLIEEKAARAHVNRFILQNLRDGFCAGQPRFVLIGQDPAWSVPLLLTKSERVIGEVLVQAIQGLILGFTPPAEVYRNARQRLA